MPHKQNSLLYEHNPSQITFHKSAKLFKLKTVAVFVCFSLAAISVEAQTTAVVKYLDNTEWLLTGNKCLH